MGLRTGKRSRYLFRLSVISRILKKQGPRFDWAGCATVNVNGTGCQVIEVDGETEEVVFELHIFRGNNFVFHRAYRTFVY